VGITVEGANILTRSMIIYGQGAIRCHPFLHDEMTAATSGDLRGFDRALCGHLNHVMVSAARAFLSGISDGRFGRAPGDRTTRRMFAQLSRMSAAFALVSDVALATLGARLKRREKISGRLADALAWLYLGSATLKRYHDEGMPAASIPLVRFACEYSLYEIQKALEGVLYNLPNRPAAWIVRPFVFPLGRRYRSPSDTVGADEAREGSPFMDFEIRESCTREDHD
jgi:acyl-CoA dehydrogenase